MTATTPTAGPPGQLPSPAGYRGASTATASEAATERAIYALARSQPEYSAFYTVARHQKIGLVGAAAVLAGGFALSPRITAQSLIALSTLAYIAALLTRFGLFWYAIRDSGRPHAISRSSITEADLPLYSVLVAAYQEPEVMGSLIASLSGLRYPADRLEILLVLEADDEQTIASARYHIRDDPRFQIIEVPASEPRTKPKALNYALPFSHGTLLSIFDAEDRPDEDQLWVAADALLNGGPKLACVQAELGYYNHSQNLITSFFTIEYMAWFRYFLPALVKLGGPVPLGGTSNHFRRSTLEAVGGWDPFNVTEDADLGLRLERLGYSIGVIESRTLEEANSDFINWVKQRSRWYKGYLQTWLVHLRRPRLVWRQLGPRGFMLMNTFIGGTPLLALLSPIFWALSIIWFIAHPDWIQTLYPTIVFYPSIVLLILGNGANLYCHFLIACREREVDLTRAGLGLSPLLHHDVNRRLQSADPAHYKALLLGENTPRARTMTAGIAFHKLAPARTSTLTPTTGPLTAGNRVRAAIVLVGAVAAVAGPVARQADSFLRDGAGQAQLAITILVAAVLFVFGRDVRPVPQIHDRQTDWIVGLPLLATAVALTAWFETQPRHEDLVFLALPLYLSGACVLVFGVRATWAHRRAIWILVLLVPGVVDGLPGAGWAGRRCAGMAGALLGPWTSDTQTGLLQLDGSSRVLDPSVWISGGGVVAGALIVAFGGFLCLDGRLPLRLGWSVGLFASTLGVHLLLLVLSTATAAAGAELLLDEPTRGLLGLGATSLLFLAAVRFSPILNLGVRREPPRSPRARLAATARGEGRLVPLTTPIALVVVVAAAIALCALTVS